VPGLSGLLELGDGLPGAVVFPEQDVHPRNDTCLWVSYAGQAIEEGVVALAVVPLQLDDKSF
jgi:hypothetical protein